MTLFHRLASIVRWIFRRDRVEQELDEELRHFVDVAMAEKIRGGMAPDEARRLAVLELGGVDQAKEHVRTRRHGAWLDEIARDVRYAGRMYARQPGFTAVIVLTLALGIGANTAIFSLVDALMLRSLPVAHPEELVHPEFRSPDGNDSSDSYSYAIVRALANEKDIFAGVAGFSGRLLDVGAPGGVTKVPGDVVTGGYYGTLGLHPVVGRLLAPDDDEPGAPLVAVISDGYWEHQFARSPDVVGQTLLVNGVPVTVVGVSPRGFVGATVGFSADITMAVAALPQIDPPAAPLLGPGNFWLRILARPRAGLSSTEAQARLAGMWPHLAEQVVAPHWNASQKSDLARAVFQLAPGATGWTFLRNIYVKPLMVLMAGVGLVLLLACANVASLLLARASSRRKEVAVRLAIGASRGRIVRQLITEGALLSLTGATLGVVLASLSGRFLVDMISTGPVQVVFDLTPNWHVLGFTTAVAVTTAVLYGLAPAIQTATTGPAAAMKEDSRSSGAPSRWLPSLVSTQVALSFVLLFGAGLFVRTLYNLRQLDPGFTPAGLLLVDLTERQASAARDLIDAVRRVAGVMSASMSTHTPLSGSVWSEPAVPATEPLPDRDTARFVGAGPDFLSTMQIPLLAGREFTDQDTAASPAVAIVNERYVQRRLAGRNPVGLHLTARVLGQRRDLEIVGLAKNTQAAGLRAAPPATVYVPYAQLSGMPATLEIRATGQVGEVAEEIRRVLQPTLPNAPIVVRALSDQVGATIVQERMMATLASGFGALALVLACIGIYGVIGYSVTRRTKEIGIRTALGAQRTRVVAMVLGGAARLIAIGIVLGVPVAWVASRAVQSLLFGLKPADPGVMTAATLLLVAAAALAAYLPARRASRVDPLVVLRHE